MLSTLFHCAIHKCKCVRMHTPCSIIQTIILLSSPIQPQQLLVFKLLVLIYFQQGEWREQGGKRKKKSNTSALKDSNHTNEDHFESRPKDRGDREDRDNGADRGDLPPRRGGRRNGGPPPRLARGRGRDRGNVGERENRDRSNTEDWDNDRGDDKKDRGGADRGRPRGKGGEQIISLT